MISRSNRTLDRLAAQDLAQKLQIETAFRNDLSKLFAKVNRNFVKYYKQHGMLSPIDQNKADIKALLIKYYKLINRKFGYQVRTNNVKSFKKLELKQIDINKQIDREFNFYNDKHAEEQSTIISETNQRDYNELIQKVKVEAALTGYLLTNAAVAEQVSNEFEDRYEWRVATIAATETQNVSEQTKLIEAAAVAGAFAAVAETPNLMKRWVSVLDERTRPEHVEADGQEVIANDPFLVGSDKLMTPGDSSLGAALSNIINCRCSAVYFSQGESI